MLLETFEQYLLENLPQSKSLHPHFEKALQDMLQAGGKRFRPMLLLSVVDALTPSLIVNALPVAFAIELLHTYSLIHDDLPCMDNADLRRGHPTLHKSFDEVTAVLVGDALNTHAFNVLANAPLSNDVKIELIASLSSDGGINGMIIGQAIDCYFENKKLALADVEYLHIHKTGKLIATSLKMGGIVANLPHKEIQKLYDFGIKIGLLFQVQDDIIDETMSSEAAGKTTQNDGAKNSFVCLMGLEESIEYANTLATQCTHIIESFEGKLAQNLTTLLSNYLFRHKS